MKCSKCGKKFSDEDAYTISISDNLSFENSVVCISCVTKKLRETKDGLKVTSVSSRP